MFQHERFPKGLTPSAAKLKWDEDVKNNAVNKVQVEATDPDGRPAGLAAGLQACNLQRPPIQELPILRNFELHLHWCCGTGN